MVVAAIPKASAFTLIFLSGFLFYAISSILDIHVNDLNARLAENGTLHISGEEINGSYSIPLIGEWKFSWLQLNDSLQKNNENVRLVDVPHSWEEEKEGPVALSLYGYGSYHLTVVTDEIYPTLAIKIPAISSAYKLFINGKLISSGGNVGTSAEEYFPDFNPEVALFNPGTRQINITLQVSNYDGYWAGIWYPLRLSNPDTLYNEQLISMIRSGVIMAILLTIAFFNLIQFTLRPADFLPFIIALSCVMVGFREIETSQILNIANIAKLDWSTYIRISFLTFYLTAAIFTSYFHFSFPKDFHKPVLVGFYLISALFSLLVLFTPPIVFNATMWWYQVLILTFMVYMIWRLYFVYKRRRYGARFILLGTLVLFVFVINDVLHNLTVIESSFMASFGLIAFTLCQTYLTIMRFIKATEDNALLSEALDKRNQEVHDFSLSLEQQISHSDQLKKVNRRLEELANLDTLTELPNRRGILPFAKQAMVRTKNEGIPFSMLLVDFDHFKQINDDLGHETGDKVLKEGAGIMKRALREQDIVARWGGEEFLVLLPSTALKGAEVLAKKLCTALRENLSAPDQRCITATIGIAEYQKDESFEQLFNRADIALYAGKNNGRDRAEMAGRVAG